MDRAKAVLFTRIFPTTERICDHGCQDLVQVTNVVDGTSWCLCVLSFERFLGQGMAAIDEYSRLESWSGDGSSVS
ncbi:hypothetical protein [Alicyclobacillus kakegawensis]|uniref:hypothetical protein n=1 Tax=Alicyclobacillus kakegawensis TaxID=392012 RepID=UPI0008361EAB|nr:hypothetical protein [Alicyclobacillus kakegawensis]